MRTLAFAVTAILLLSTVDGARAADLPAKAPNFGTLPPVAHNWTGFYLGGHVGAGWATNDWFSPLLIDVVPSAHLGVGSATGFLGGAQAGFNYQFDAMVFGIEADVSWARISGEACNTLEGTIHCTSKADRLGTITGRFGIAADRTLVYFKGGAAWLHDTQVFSILTAMDASPSGNKWGWTAGAGIEYALTRSWSAKVEYDFMDFGTSNFVFVSQAPGGGSVTSTANIEQRVQTVKLGLNYRFDWPSR